MGVFTFCRATLRRGHSLKRTKSSKGKDANHNRNGNKKDVIAGPDRRVDARVHEPRFEVRLVRGQEDATVDIVVVHCLSDGSSSSAATTERRGNGLATALSEDFPGSRIIAFSQTSQPFRCSLNDAISQGAAGLVRAIRFYRSRSNQPRRPIVFLSHSLGGLIVQSALVMTREARDPLSREIYAATRGMMYFGVPGPSSSVERLQGVLADISRILGMSEVDAGVEKGVRDLESFGPDAAALAETMKAYEGIGDRLHSVSACFCETMPTATPNGPVIVDEDCVTRAAEVIEVRRTHADLLWFDGGQDDGYDALKDWIALVLHPAVVNDDTRRFPLLPEELESFTDAHAQVSFLRTDFGVPAQPPPVSTYHIRSDLLGALRERFSGPSSSSRIPVVALTGDLGVGKTFLAHHFSRRVSETGRPAFWLNAASRETLCTSYLQIGRSICDYYWNQYSETLLSLCGGNPEGGRAYLRSMLGVADIDELLDAMDFKQVDQLKVSASIRGIVSWLLYPGNEWLLILDNVGDGVDLTEFIPLKLGGWVLAIAQGRGVVLPPGATTVEVAPWSEDEARELLLAEVGLTHDAAQADAALDIVRGLELRPSSIVQAAVHTRQRKISLHDYLAATKAADEPLSNLDEHPRKDQMKEVMSVVATLSDAPLPLDLLTSIENAVGTRLSGDSGCAWWRNSGVDNSRRTKILDSLKDLNLLEEVPPEPSLRLPPALRRHFSDEQATHAWLAASACVTTLQRQKISPGTLSDIHSSSRLLLPHALACHAWAEHLRDHEPSKRGPKRVDFSVLGELCVAHGFSTEAISFLEIALKRGERDGETLDVGQRAEAMLTLAVLYKGRDDDRCDDLLEDIDLSDEFMDAGLEFRIRFTIAERLVERGQLDEALMQLDRLANAYPGIPPDYRSVLAHRTRARVYRSKRFLDSAAACHGPIAAQLSSLMGASHPATLEEEEKEAVAVAETIRAPAAVTLLRACFAVKSASLGTHPSVFETQFRLAALLDGLFEYEEADVHFEEAMAGMEGLLGEYHPAYLDSKEELALCFAGRAQRAGLTGEKRRGRELRGDALGILRDVAFARGEVGMDAEGTSMKLKEVEDAEADGVVWEKTIHEVGGSSMKEVHV